MVNMQHPADELAELRVQMRALKARELELRKRLLHGHCGLQGKAHQVVLRQHKRRVFIKERLPDYVLAEPSLWETRTLTHVVTEERQRPALRAVRPGDPLLLQDSVQDWGADQFEVIERPGSAHQLGQLSG